jgi:DNA primase
LRILAQKAGVELKHYNKNPRKYRKTKAFMILRVAAAFFEKQLQVPVGTKSKRIFVGRGLEPETIKSGG